MAGAAPLNGTKVGCTPSSEWSSRQVVYVIEPTPACARFTLSAFAFTIGDEFLEVVGRKVLPRRDHDRQAGDHADRLEIDIRLVGEVRIERHRGSMRPHLTDLDGVAVGSGAHRSGRAGGAARPGDVLDDELLPERAREVLADDAANNVGRCRRERTERSP